MSEENKEASVVGADGGMGLSCWQVRSRGKQRGGPIIQSPVVIGRTWPLLRVRCGATEDFGKRRDAL